MSLGLHVITGFLGAGKTTVLNAWLTHPSLQSTLVLVNEFGEVGIDHHLYTSLLNTPDRVMLLPSGCVCCEIREDLLESLGQALDLVDSGQVEPFHRVVLETTGLYDPSPYETLLGRHSPLLGRFQLDGVLTVVDASLGQRLLLERAEARQQVAVADRIVLTKTDLAPEGEIQSLLEELRSLNPRAEVLRKDEVIDPLQALSMGLRGTQPAKLETERFLPQLGGFQLEPRSRDSGWALGGSPGPKHADVRSLSLELPGELSLERWSAYVSMLVGFNRERILRIKGLLQFSGQNSLMAFDVVYGVVHPMMQLPPLPHVQGASRVVVIASQMNEEELTQLEAGIRSCVC